MCNTLRAQGQCFKRTLKLIDDCWIFRHDVGRVECESFETWIEGAFKEIVRCRTDAKADAMEWVVNVRQVLPPFGWVRLISQKGILGIGHIVILPYFGYIDNSWQI